MKKKSLFLEYCLGIGGFALITLCSNVGTGIGIVLVLIGAELMKKKELDKIREIK